MLIGWELFVKIPMHVTFVCCLFKTIAYIHLLIHQLESAPLYQDTICACAIISSALISEVQPTRQGTFPQGQRFSGEMQARSERSLRFYLEIQLTTT